MKKGMGIIALILIMLTCMTSCSSSDSNDDPPSNTITNYAGSDPVGDFIVIQIDKTNSKVRHINYTADPDEDSGWLDYTKIAAADAEGFSNQNRVELSGGEYVIFAEFPNTAIVYQLFDASNDAVGNPVYAVLREKVDIDSYYEKAYNWMKFEIDASTATDSEMEVGFAAFDASSNEGLLYGAGYYGYDDTISDINSGDIQKVTLFEENTALIANTMWGGAVGDMDNAITLTGTQSGTNILDFGPASGGGMGLAIPQSDVSLATASGTYFLLVYEADKVGGTSSVEPMKLVISSTSPHIKVFPYNGNTETDSPVFSDDLTAVADLTAGESPGGTTPIMEQFATASGNSAAVSSVVQNAHESSGTFAATDPNYGLAIIFDPLGGFCGFTMTDNSTDTIRFGFGIKDSLYTNL